MSPSVKLTYFAFAIHGEAIRLALRIGSVDCEDERISFEQLGAARKAGSYPFGSLSVLTVDVEMYSQSAALLRFAGKLTRLYPKCEKDAMKVDMVVDATEDHADVLFKDSSEKGRAELLANANLRPFLLGETMTIADFKLAGWASWLNDSKTFHSLAATEGVMASEKVKEWYAKH